MDFVDGSEDVIYILSTWKYSKYVIYIPKPSAMWSDDGLEVLFFKCLEEEASKDRAKWGPHHKSTVLLIV